MFFPHTLLPFAHIVNFSTNRLLQPDPKFFTYIFIFFQGLLPLTLILLLFYISLMVEQVFHRIPHNPSVGRQVQLSTNRCRQLPREEHLREAELTR